ncbi:F-box/LRR-repeat protein At3g26922 isoform X2 [Spinacia oleracea]|uniref:F-box/LRR-repeat protein At3g26922 isoform X2 n=1 Tax=Spinacia oleracea TaxID=3562 RepID=A0ABM3R8C4_SPIOL|nr:F-box/LRR-repeat protein At3g26922-like isoform X2 [Spinacia oleracea]
MDASRCQTSVLELCDVLTPLKPKSVECSTSDKGIKVVKDRISSLPDYLLADILSFLPFKDAVVTSVLSKRWKGVFTLVTCLHFDDSPISHCLHRPHRIHSFPIFKIFVDNLLKQCCSTYLTTYRLHFGKGKFNRFECGESCFPNMSRSHLKSWISFPICHGVRELEIFARVRSPTVLPSALYRCKTLEVLKLDINLNLGVPLSTCFPNMKEFHLTFLDFPKDNSVTRLISRCPSLEYLALTAVNWKLVNPVNICSPSLRRLAINITDNWFKKPRSKVVLNVPNLEYLNYVDVWSLSYSIGDMNSLVEAEVNIAARGSFETVLNLISSLSNVRRLHLMAMCVQVLNQCEILKHKLPVFRNLNHLQLGCWNYFKWNKILMELLTCAPFLETLTFTEFNGRWEPEVAEAKAIFYDLKLAADCRIWVLRCNNGESDCPNSKAVFFWNHFCDSSFELCVLEFCLQEG